MSNHVIDRAVFILNLKKAVCSLYSQHISGTLLHPFNVRFIYVLHFGICRKWRYIDRILLNSIDIDIGR